MGFDCAMGESVHWRLVVLWTSFVCSVDNVPHKAAESFDEKRVLRRTWGRNKMFVPKADLSSFQIHGVSCTTQMDSQTQKSARAHTHTHARTHARTYTFVTEGLSNETLHCICKRLSAVRFHKPTLMTKCGVHKWQTHRHHHLRREQNFP